jgi:biopolymer transport protein TolR
MASPYRSTRHRRSINQINMVPFIDVMLVLLIIFMVTAPLITPSMIDLPSVSKAPKQPDRVIQVMVRQDQSLQIRHAGNDYPSSMGQVAEQVRQMQMTPTPATEGANGLSAMNTAVVISAEKSVAYEAVVKLMDSLQRAGIARVGLSVQLAPPSSDQALSNTAAAAANSANTPTPTPAPKSP